MTREVQEEMLEALRAARDHMLSRPSDHGTKAFDLVLDAILHAEIEMAKTWRQSFSKKVE